MLRQLAAAVAFLTRLPVGKGPSFTAEDVGRSAKWFPLVGVFIGGLYALAAHGLAAWFPSMLTAVIIVVIEALLTGALHLDGLADMADGFGGGRSREDVLRIMRDHSIGAYGAVALILIILLKVSAVSTLIDRHSAVPYLMLSPVLGRWSAVLLSYALPYARRTTDEGLHAGGAITDFVGWRELAVSTLIAFGVAVGMAHIFGIVCWLGVAAVSAGLAFICRARIGGVTGDTLGASVEISEAVVFLMGVAVQ